MSIKIIYICYLPLNEKIERDFYIRDLVAEGVDVEFWDVSKIYFPNIEYQNIIVRDYNKYVLDMNMLKQQIKSASRDGIFIPIITFEARVLRLYFYLRIFNCKTIFFARGTLPFYNAGNDTKVVFKKIINKLKNITTIYSTTLNFISRLARYFFGIGKYDVVFAAGQIAADAHRSISKHIVECNYIDYDLFLSLKDNVKKQVQGKEKYFVFLDEYLPFHQDFEMLKQKTVDGNYYSNIMTKLFDKIEEATGFKTIIACHPQAKYTETYFGGRAMLHGVTAELVQNAEFCIVHITTSVAFPVAFKKPILFVYPEELLVANPGYIELILKFGQILGYQARSIEKILSDPKPFNVFSDIYHINEDKYEEYIAKYLSCIGTRDKMTKNIFLNHIKGSSVV